MVYALHIPAGLAPTIGDGKNIGWRWQEHWLKISTEQTAIRQKFDLRVCAPIQNNTNAILYCG